MTKTGHDYLHKGLFVVMGRAICGSFCRAEDVIFNVVNERVLGTRKEHTFRT